jgi:hypothetical protein
MGSWWGRNCKVSSSCCLAVIVVLRGKREKNVIKTCIYSIHFVFQMHVPVTTFLAINKHSAGYNARKIYL